MCIRDSPIGSHKNNWIFKQLITISERYNFDLKDPIKKIPKTAIDIILNGGNESFSVESKSLGLTRKYHIDFEGIIPFIESQFNENHSSRIKRWAKGFMVKENCNTCLGSRLNKESMHFYIDSKSITDLCAMDIEVLKKWFSKIESKLSERKKLVASEIIKELNKRIDFLLNVGLDYLSLNRPSKSLSGGESQRIRSVSYTHLTLPTSDLL